MIQTSGKDDCCRLDSGLINIEQTLLLRWRLTRRLDERLRTYETLMCIISHVNKSKKMKIYSISAILLQMIKIIELCKNQTKI